MLEFNPDDPFPLLPDGLANYREAQAHSEQVDRWLGLEIKAVEARLSPLDGQELWVSLPPERLLTPYTELRTLLEILKPIPGETVVDLGAAYGRMGFVLAKHFPAVEFLGFEFVSGRVQEGLRCLRAKGCGDANLVVADLAHADFQPPAARYYFLYDYGTRRAIDKTLEDLRRLAKERAIIVIGRGRASRDAIERGQPWLSQVVTPEHYAHFSIYRT